MGVEDSGNQRDDRATNAEDAQTERLPGTERASQWRAAQPTTSAPRVPPAARLRADTRSRPLTLPRGTARTVIVPAGRTRAHRGRSGRADPAAPPAETHPLSSLPLPLALAARLSRALRTRPGLRVAQWLVALAVVAAAALVLGAANHDPGPAGDAVRLWESRAGVKVLPPNVTPPGGWQAYDADTRATIDKIALAFGPDTRTAQAAVNVAWCESDFDPQARNPVAIGGSHAEGLFQILWPSTWNTTSQAAHNPFDPDANILAAHELWSRDGQSWVEWACQP